MKKLLFLSLLSVLLSGCSVPFFGKESNDKINQEEAQQEETHEEQDEKHYPQSVLNSLWGLEAAKASYDALGLAIPFIENDSFEYKAGIDDYGDKDIWFYCYYETDEASEEAFDKYVEICVEKGFTGSVQTVRNVDYETLTYIEFEMCYCDRVIKDATGTKEFGVELQFLVSYYNEKPCLGIYGFTYVYSPSNVFPSNALDYLYGEEGHSFVPELANDCGYEYAFEISLLEDNSKCLTINVMNASYEIEEEYYDMLCETEEFSIGYSSETSEYMYLSENYGTFDDDRYFVAFSNEIMIYFDYDLYSSIFILEFYISE